MRKPLPLENQDAPTAILIFDVPRRRDCQVQLVTFTVYDSKIPLRGMKYRRLVVGASCCSPICFLYTVEGI
jgi:hypothetical protein